MYMAKHMLYFIEQLYTIVEKQRETHNGKLHSDIV